MSANAALAALPDSFKEEIQRLREANMHKVDSSNLYFPFGLSYLECDSEVVNSVEHCTYWYQQPSGIVATPDSKPSEQVSVIRFADIPGTLSGDILRLERNIPPLDPTGNYEIIGDVVQPLQNPPPLPEEFEDDSEDVSVALASLPKIKVDPAVHHVKNPKYVSEVQNLLACQGGSCPGDPISPHIIQLLGRSANGELVFEKLKTHFDVLVRIHPLSQYKTWILHFIDGLRCLHSLGIVHRDLRIYNIVFSNDTSRLLICDLESRGGNLFAPELSHNATLNAGWSISSDIYDVAFMIRCMLYCNSPRTRQLAREWPLPAPLDKIVRACTQRGPEDRPSLDELYDMVENIDVSR